MNRIKNCVYLIIGVVLLSGCFITNRNNIKIRNVNSEKADERSVYYAFTEATKQQLFGNLRQAENLYRKCITQDDSSAASYYQLSRIYFVKRNADSSIKFAQKAEKFDNDNFWYKLNLARIYELTGNNDSVIAVYERIVDKFEQKINIAITLAQLYKNKSDFKKAITLLDTLEKKYGYNPEISTIKLEVYLEQKKTDKAVDELKKIIKVYNDNITFYNELATLYTKMEDFNKADSIYSIAFDIDSTNPNLKISYANYLRKKGEKKKAYNKLKNVIKDTSVVLKTKVKIFYDFLFDEELIDNDYLKIDTLAQILLDINGNDNNVRAVLADFYIKIDSFNQASKHLKYLIDKSNKNNYFLWEQLFYLYSMNNNYDSIYHYSNEAIQIFPEKPEVYLYKGMSGIEIDNNKEAAKALETGKNLIVNNDVLKADFYYHLGEAYMNMKEYKKSDNAFEKALKINNEDYTLMNNYSYYLSERGKNLKRAEELSKKTIEKEPDNFIYLDTYGWILYKMEKYKKAKKYIKRSIELGGNTHKEIVEHYIEILKKLGEDEKIEKYKEILENIE